MAGKTKALSGPGKDKFLRAIAADAADKGALLEALHATVPEIRVRLEVWKETLTRHKPSHDSPPKQGPVETKAEPKPFDPYAFSAMAVLTKQGRAGLESKLASIASANDLRALADAQHLAVDAQTTDAATLRAAIIAGAERRIAERIAAAS
jgi:hypothetical protein